VKCNGGESGIGKRVRKRKLEASQNQPLERVKAGRGTIQRQEKWEKEKKVSVVFSSSIVVIGGEFWAHLALALPAKAASEPSVLRP
jgi:hypothetical protein